MPANEFNIVRGPVWPNDCPHPANEYVCSFVDQTRTYDLYLYGHGTPSGLCMCLRYGECGRIVCPLPMAQQLVHQPYGEANTVERRALVILDHYGKFMVDWQLMAPMPNTERPTLPPCDIFDDPAF